LIFAAKLLGGAIRTIGALRAGVRLYGTGQIDNDGSFWRDLVKGVKSLDWGLVRN